VLIYSICTGLTFFSSSFFDFALFRFLTGLGVGGVFGLAVALIAETMPEVARTAALGALQILSAIGNISAALLKSFFDYLQRVGAIRESWRWLFLAGAVPAVLIVFAHRHLREPQQWLDMKSEGRLPRGGIVAPYIELLSDKRWRRNLVVGALLAATGVIGLWAIGEYAVDLQRFVFTRHFVGVGEPATQVEADVNQAITSSYILNMLGAALGMWLFSRAVNSIGRRPAFAIGFVAAMLVTVFVYWKLESPWDAYWMMPLMGAAQLSVFAGFAIYLPELFPSRLRSTGTSFCYNFGRFAAAAGSLVSARLATNVYGQFGSPLMERFSAMSMCSIFLVGLFVLPFAPETKGASLPE
jgi:MFS family permease